MDQKRVCRGTLNLTFIGPVFLNQCQSANEGSPAVVEVYLDHFSIALARNQTVATW